MPRKDVPPKSDDTEAKVVETFEQHASWCEATAAERERYTHPFLTPSNCWPVRTEVTTATLGRANSQEELLERLRTLEDALSGAVEYQKELEKLDGVRGREFRADLRQLRQRSVVVRDECLAVWNLVICNRERLHPLGIKSDELRTLLEEYDAHPDRRTGEVSGSDLQPHLEQVQAAREKLKTQNGASVVLHGPGKPVTVLGKQKPRLTRPQHDVVQALLDAGKEGLTKDLLVYNSGHTDAVGILTRLKRKDDWGQVIQMAGTTGGGYRIF